MTTDFIKKMSAIFIIALLAFSWSNSYAGQDPKTSMYDALANGYSATVKRNKALAIEWFKKAASLARKARSWQGCIDSGYGLLALEQINEAELLFTKAFAFAERNRDWRGCVASGYAYSGLPIMLKKQQAVISAFEKAARFSKRDGDWRGLLEAGKGLFSIGRREPAVKYYNQAFQTAKKLESAEGLKNLAVTYRESGNPEKARECSRLAGASIAPPAGWQPAGETVAGPPQISPEIQKANRLSADKEIAQKIKWLIEQKKAEVKRKEKANVCLNYYYPYANYFSWRPTYGSWTVGWASYCLRNYYFSNGLWYWRTTCP
ncbi:MAG: tetratricopeptide repeat protein [Candidatus Omnitrophota bacterium]|nr:tetratricopeptide repeat protein [Candidatus Omnitrophota bacterium]